MRIDRPSLAQQSNTTGEIRKNPNFQATIKLRKRTGAGIIKGLNESHQRVWEVRRDKIFGENFNAEMALNDFLGEFAESTRGLKRVINVTSCKNPPEKFPLTQYFSAKFKWGGKTLKFDFIPDAIAPNYRANKGNPFFEAVQNFVLRIAETIENEPGVEHANPFRLFYYRLQ